MKVIISVISSLVVGLIMGASNYSPLIELQRLLEARKKVLYAIMLGATAFVFVMTAVILSSIEVAQQYEAQGFLMWNAMLTLSAIFLGVGIFSGAMAKVVFPEPKIPESLKFMEGGAQHPIQFLEGLAKQLFTEPGSPFAGVFKSEERREAPTPPSPSHAPAAHSYGHTDTPVTH